MFIAIRFRYALDVRELTKSPPSFIFTVDGYDIGEDVVRCCVVVGDKVTAFSLLLLVVEF